MGKLTIALLLMILPTGLARLIANTAGHRISRGARIGLSLVMAECIAMAPTARIGHGSIVNVRRLLMRERAGIGHLNLCSGPLTIRLGVQGVIGNRNSVTRAGKGVSTGLAQLQLGTLSKITANHSVDCCASVIFGNFTTLAGKGSQIWSHGYVHGANGSARYRVDGPIHLGNNVYIGSRCIITGGVTMVDHVTVGVGVSVTKALKEPGFYVSAPMRMLPHPVDPDTRSDLCRVDNSNLVEAVYVKTSARAG